MVLYASFTRLVFCVYVCATEITCFSTLCVKIAGYRTDDGSASVFSVLWDTALPLEIVYFMLERTVAHAIDEKHFFLYYINAAKAEVTFEKYGHLWILNITGNISKELVFSILTTV